MALKQSVPALEFDPDKAISEIEAASKGGSSLFRSIQSSQENFALHHEFERKATIRMAALKRFSPLILAVIHRPGPQGSNETISQALRGMMDSSYSLAKEIVDRISGGQLENEFIQNQAITAVSEFIGTEWAFNGSANVRDQVMFALDHLASMDDVVELVGKTKWRPGENSSDAEINAGLTMSALKAAEPLLTLLLDYEVHDATVFEKLSDHLMAESMDYLSKVSEGLPSLTRLMTIQNHIAVSGRILKASLQTALHQQQPSLEVKLDLAPVLEDWKKGLRMLVSAVTAKVDVAFERADLLKPNPQKEQGMEP